MKPMDGNVDRRAFLKLTAAVGVGATVSEYAWGDGSTTTTSPTTTTAPSTGPSTAPATAPSIAPPPETGAPPTPASLHLSRHMARFPEKTDLYLVTDRPPQLETPLKYFQQDITPNNAFFVRWHLAGIPTEVDTSTFRLNLGGHVDQPLSLSIDELTNHFEPASVVAVVQCSGNSRGFFQPRVAAGQWGQRVLSATQNTRSRVRLRIAASRQKSRREKRGGRCQLFRPGYSASHRAGTFCQIAELQPCQ